MTINTYLLGNVVQLNSTFTTQSGTPTNPTSVTLSVLNALGSIDSPTVTNSSAGVYTASYTPATAGLYFYYWTGTGAVTAASQGQFNVIAPEA